MPEYAVTKHFSNSGTRNEVRMRVVYELANKPTGNDVTLICENGREEVL